MGSVDKASTGHAKKHSVALRYGDIFDKAEVAWGRAHEHDGVLALDNEAGYVEGSEAGELVRERWIVSIANSARWEASDELVVNENGQLANTIVAVINLKALESQDHRLTGDGASHCYRVGGCCGDAVAVGCCQHDTECSGLRVGVGRRVRCSCAPIAEVPSIAVRCGSS